MSIKHHRPVVNMYKIIDRMHNAIGKLNSVRSMPNLCIGDTQAGPEGLAEMDKLVREWLANRADATEMGFVCFFYPKTIEDKVKSAAEMVGMTLEEVSQS